MEDRVQDLERYLAEDVVFVGPGGTPRIEGLVEAVESYRQFLAHAIVTRFETFDHSVTRRGDTAVLEYGWQMAWRTGGQGHREDGRDVLVLAHLEGKWRVVWRTQIPASTN